ncbi:hypothetical protein QBC43DRAFT_321915 [Cladorrhinum sp. PSN259]|nr:hypothetical protein QBC43DRAFT_321915 [Cladorrhinum sp. PSN259]
MKLLCRCRIWKIRYIPTYLPLKNPFPSGSPLRIRVPPTNPKFHSYQNHLTISPPTMSPSDNDPEKKNPKIIHEVLAPLVSGSSSEKDITTAVRTVTDLANEISTPKREKSVVDAYREDIVHDELSTLFWQLYSEVFNLVGKTPAAQQAPLISFLVQLQKETIKPDFKFEEDASIWHDLPQFGWAARDFFNFEVSNPSVGEKEKARWENITYFLANLTMLSAPGRKGIEAFDFSLYGLWAIREALEEGGEGEQEDTTEIAIKLAAVWFNVAGERLKALSEEGKVYTARTGVAGTKYEKTKPDWVGLNKERWGIWKEELKARSEKSVRSGEVKGLVASALELWEE